MADMRSSDILAYDWANRAREILDAYKKNPEAKKAPELYPGGTFKLTEDKKPTNALYRLLSDPKLNRGLENTLTAIPSAVLGEESGNSLVDYGAANIPGLGAAAILAAGGMPGIVDVVGAHELKNAAGAAKRVLKGAFDVASERAAKGELFGSKGGFLGLGDWLTKESIDDIDNADEYLKWLSDGDRSTNKLVLDAMQNTITNSELQAALTGIIQGTDIILKTERSPAMRAKLTNSIGAIRQLFDGGLDIGQLRNLYSASLNKGFMRDWWKKQEALEQVANAEKARALEGTKESARKMGLFTGNPKAAAKEMVDNNLSIEEYLGDALSEIRPGQRKQVENELRKLGVDIPEEVVEVAPVVEKPKKVKEVQIPKSEQQRLQAIETAQKTWKREPNKVFKSIAKGRTPEDYFKGAENVPEDFAEKYANYVAEKEGRKAAQAVEAERAAQAAETNRQSGALTEKQAERIEADRIAREQIEAERAKAEAARAAEKAAYDSRRPSAVLASGWKPEEHPLGSFNPNAKPTPPSNYALMDSKANPFTPEEKRDLFVADSLAGEVLKNFWVSDKFPDVKLGPGGLSNNAARHSNELTNYSTLWPEYAKKMDEARKLGLFSDNVKRGKVKTINKDGVTYKLVDTDYLESEHPVNKLMSAIYGQDGVDNSLNLYELMFRRNLDDILQSKNPAYRRELDPTESGTKASKILKTLQGIR